MRGNLVTIVLQEDFGKPRPALVIQSDYFDAHPSITVLPVTSDLRDTPLFRILVQPTTANGLPRVSQIMVDKAMTIARDKAGEKFGQLEPETLMEVDRCLALFLGIVR